MTRTHSRCDRSAEDAYSPMAPYPIIAFVGGACCPTFDFAFAFWIIITLDRLLFSEFFNVIIYHFDMLIVCISPI
jgi:hypothetical protein